MKKLLFTIVGFLQIMLVLAQVPPMGRAASQSQGNKAAQKAAAYNVHTKAASQNPVKAWLIVDVEGTMPNGFIPSPKGAYESMPYRAIKHH